MINEIICQDRLGTNWKRIVIALCTQAPGRCTRTASSTGAINPGRFLDPFCTKNAIILPRRARDKHRESTQKKDVSSTAAGRRLQRSSSGKKTHLLQCHCILKLIILPRQARDKHGESTQKQMRFLRGNVAGECSANEEPPNCPPAPPPPPRPAAAAPAAATGGSAAAGAAVPAPGNIAHCAVNLTLEVKTAESLFFRVS